MEQDQHKYNIKAVSKLLGIQPGTLRAWERRYKIIAPSRNEAGHRLYTDEHIQVLRWLIQKVNEGFTISQAVTLLETNEKEMITNIATESLIQHDLFLDYQKQLLNAMLGFDDRAIKNILNRAFSLYTIETVLMEIVFKTLTESWERLDRGEVTTVHTQYLSSTLRFILGAISVAHNDESNGLRAIVFCGSGEQEENGALMMTIYLRRKGINVTYLSVDVVGNELFTVVEELNPNLLIISCLSKSNLEAAFELCEQFNVAWEGSYLGIGVISHLFHELEKPLYRRYNSFNIGFSLQEWDAWLDNIRGA